jgi:hypothetical protein
LSPSLIFVHLPVDTMGNRRFAECLIHSVKVGLLSTKSLPRVTFDKALTTNDFSANSLLM